LRLDDPRVSEAHAIISLRRLELKLLALRGRFSVEGKPRTEEVLAVGQRIVLAGVLPLVPLAVMLPEEVPALMLRDGQPPMPVNGVVSFFAGEGHFEAGFGPDADAVFWSSSSGVRMRTRAGEERELWLGAELEVGGRALTLALVARGKLVAQATEGDRRFESRLRIAVYFDTVHIASDDGRSAVLDGLVARAVSELATMRVPIHWQSLCEGLWPETKDPATLRPRWDQVLVRLRSRLREAGLRGDLVRANRKGLVELFLGPDDTVEDVT